MSNEEKHKAKNKLQKLLNFLSQIKEVPEKNTITETQNNNSQNKGCSNTFAESNSNRSNQAKSSNAENKESNIIETNYETDSAKRRLLRYRPAPTSLLNASSYNFNNEQTDKELRETAYKIEDKLREFGIETEVKSISRGAAWTRFELTLKAGVRINQILSLKNDLKLMLSAEHLEIKAPIPGKSTIGIDIYNKNFTRVVLRKLLETKEFRYGNETAIVLGCGSFGGLIICDFSTIQSLLITGYDDDQISTLRDVILCGFMCKSSPKSVRMIIIDTKISDLHILNGIPHLITPVINETSRAIEAINWLNKEIQTRSSLIMSRSMRGINDYNNQMDVIQGTKLPHIVVLINTMDVLAYQDSSIVENLCSIISKSQFVGIHVIACTRANIRNGVFQRLNEIITSKIIFAVPNIEISNAIIGVPGAESLLGNGELYYLPNKEFRLIRGNSAQVSTEEVSLLSDYLNNLYGPLYIDEEVIDNTSARTNPYEKTVDTSGLFEQAVEAVLDSGSASVSVLQRRLGIGYPRAARLIDELEKKHIIGPFEGSRPRKILITKTEWLERKNNNR